LTNIINNDNIILEVNNNFFTGGVIMKEATIKQMNFIKEMQETLLYEFNYDDIEQKQTYTIKEAKRLIFLNKDDYYEIIYDGKCTPAQYLKLTEIAGRKPRFERQQISRLEALTWIEKYSKKIS
jgi:hypothetical protein